MSTKVNGSNMPSDNGYGQNGYGGASSDNPGSRTRAPLTVNRDGADPELERIKKVGAQMVAPVNAKPRPTTFGMKPSTPADTPRVPGAVTWGGPGKYPTTRK